MAHTTLSKSANSLLTSANANSLLYVDGDGKAALGSASVGAYEFLVQSAAAVGGILINNTATDGDAVLGFQLSGTSIFTIGVDDGDGDKFKIGTTAVGTNTILTITSGGNVGIGTDDPVGNLHVARTGGMPSMKLERIGTEIITNQAIGSYMVIAGEDGGRGDVGQLRMAATQTWTSTASGTEWQFYTTTDNALTSTQKMVLSNEGRLGIGEDDPGSVLHVRDTAGSAVMKGEMNYDYSGSNYAGVIYLRNIDTTVNNKVGIAFGFSETDVATNYIPIGAVCGVLTTPGDSTTNAGGAVIVTTNVVGGSMTEKLRVTSSGNLGINTPNQFGSGVGVIGILNAGTNPSGNPTGGGVIYCDGGALKYRGSGGTVTTLGPA